MVNRCRVLGRELQEHNSNSYVKYKIVQIQISHPLLIKVVGLVLLYICKQISSLTWFLVEGIEKVTHKLIETANEETINHRAQLPGKPTTTENV